MSSLAALLLIVVFMLLLIVSKVPRHANRAFSRSRQALADMRSDTLTEEQKERAVQKHAIALFGSFALVTVLSIVALSLPAGVAWLLARAELLDFDATLAATLSWPVLLAATVIGLALFGRRRRPA